MYETEKKVPIPEPTRGGPKGSSKYPPQDMKRGDSFLVPVGDGQRLVKVQSRVSSAIARFVGKNGGKFITRQVEGGVRC